MIVTMIVTMIVAMIVAMIVTIIVTIIVTMIVTKGEYDLFLYGCPPLSASKWRIFFSKHYELAARKLEASSGYVANE